jgi:hypothetical protein
MLANLFGSTSGLPSTSAVNYIPVLSVNDTPTATETSRFQLLPAAFTVSNFYVTVNTAPGAASSGKQYVFTIRKNQVDTAATITIFETATSGTYNGAGISFAAGDLITIGITPTGTPTAPTLTSWNLQCNSGGTHFSPIVGGNHSSTGLSTASVTYAQLTGSSTGTQFNTAEALVTMVCPCAGTLNNLYVKANGVAGTNNTWAMGLTQNGTVTALSASISGASATTANDITHSITVAAGDTLSMAATPTGTPTSRNISWALQFTPTNVGETFFGFGTSTAPSTTSTVYEFPLGNGGGSYTSEASRQVIPGACMLKSFYVLLGTAPGGVTTRTFNIRRNGVNSDLNVSFTGAAVTGNITGQTVGLGQTSLISLQSSETGTPAPDTNGVHMGVLQYIPVSSPTTGDFFQLIR